jgi:hypothetical protein
LNFLLKRLRGIPRLTVIDAPKFLRKINSQSYMTELNPILDEVLRNTFTWLKFREMQRERLLQMQEIATCMAHDAMIFIRMAKTALWLETKERPGMEDSEKYIALSSKLEAAAVEFRVYSLLALARINFWLVVRTQWWCPLPAPRISSLSRVGGFTFHSSYRAFKEAVAALCLEYGQEFHDEIVPLI